MKKTTNTLLAMLGAGTLLGAAAGLGPAVEREGDAAHRASLSEMETMPFDLSLLAGLDSWTHGEALDASAIEGKVVLVGIVTVNDPQSMLVLSTLARYERLHGDDGLVVLAVHPELGWDAMNEKVSQGRVKVQVARDTGGALAQALHADDTPDLYLIDRAGQLRFADIETRSLKSAVAQLLRESGEEAVANAKLQAQGIEPAAPDKAEGVASARRQIPPAAYAKADWPEFNHGRLTGDDYQGKPLPVPLGEEDWLTEKRDLEGKVIVLDFWATWCGFCKQASPMLEEMQVKHAGQLEVLAIGGSNDDEGNHRKYVIAHEKAYSNLYDKNSTIYRQLQVTAIPHTLIISTDGVIRWQGNPLSPEFTEALEQVIAVDPLLVQQSASNERTKPGMAPAGGAIPSDAYARANWPDTNSGKLYSSDNQGKTLPVPLGGEKWLTDEVDTTGKVVMLDFWATWCPPCREFSPIADRLQRKYADKLQIIGVSGDKRDSEDKVRGYLAEHHSAYAHVYDASQSVSNALGITGIPHVVIMSTDGVIRWEGFPLDPGFEAALARIIMADPMLNDG